MEVWKISLFVRRCCAASLCFRRFAVPSEMVVNAIVFAGSNLVNFFFLFFGASM